MTKSFPRAGATFIALVAMVASVAADKVELAKPEQVADAKAQVAAVGMGCTVGDVRYVGTGRIKIDNKEVDATGYEVTCGNGFGFVIQGPKGGSPDSTIISCFGSSATKGKNADCKLPQNLNGVAQAQAAVTAIGLSCQVSDVKWRGYAPKAKLDIYEIACGAGKLGYILTVPHAAGAATTESCLRESGNLACTLSTEAERAKLLADFAPSKSSCQPTKYRSVGVSDTGVYYEVACASGPGFMVELNKKEDAMVRVMDCVDAASTGGGCTLTDKAVIAASANSSFGSRLQAAGIACTITGTRVVGETAKHEEMVEFGCSDRPAGLIALFPATPGGKTDSVDCLNSAHFGTQCTLTPPEQIHALLSKALAASGATCAVSGYKNLGTSPDKTIFLELTCTGGSGYIAEFPMATYAKAITPTTCAEAAKTSKSTGLECTIPGNH